MEQFSLDKWLQDRSRKVVTRLKKSVQIISIEGKEDIPIVALIEGVAHQYKPNGYHADIVLAYSNQCRDMGDYDLFFADDKKTNKILDELKYYLENTPKEQVEKDWKEIQDWYSQHFTNEKCNKEEELTEFEKAVQSILNEPHFQDVQSVKQFSKALLDLARKELEENYYTKVLDDKIVFKSGLNATDLQTAYDMGKQDALKDLPKWKKATENMEFDKHVLLFEDEDRVVLTTELYKDEYYIELDDLKTLPKEE